MTKREQIGRMGGTARTVKVEPPERICLSCGVRIGRLSTIAYALIGGLCAGCDHREGMGA